MRVNLARSVNFFSALALACALGIGGCGAGSTTSGDGAVEPGTSAEALTSAAITNQLVGGYHDVNGAFPALTLDATGGYAIDTGVRCLPRLEHPCTSVERGTWTLHRLSTALFTSYDAVLTPTTGTVHWLTVQVQGDVVAPKLVGEYGFTTTFVKNTTYCVEYERPYSGGSSFYAQNVDTYAAGTAVLASVAASGSTNGAVRAGACQNQPRSCASTAAPDCGRLFTAVPITYDNSCTVKVAVRDQVAVSGSASGSWTIEVCAPTGPACGGIAGIACPGFGTCLDNPNDSCDPTHGGVDCSGVCVCDALPKCVAGQTFDSSAGKCMCVPAAP